MSTENSVPRVLLVDDDPDVLAELSEGLDALGLPSLTAETAVEALDIVQRHDDLQVIVTDLQMPRIDGIELLQKLAVRRRTKPMAAIVITGHASLDRAVGALRLHAVDFLQKPLSAEEVAHAIHRAFSLVEDETAAANGNPTTLVQPTARPNYLKALVAARADRDAIFQAGLFSDPAWDMLLDLAVAEATNRPISVTSLCIASGVPTTTALRRIDDLKDAGLLDRIPDPGDRRRILVKLTAMGRERMEAFVQKQAGRLGLKLD
ncbi:MULTISPECIES: response regulator [Azorhizobium]|uniref:Regulatory protein n=1 Tax=Azorhizobium caulinodans (strain ATCC 43989 / DSM 5975 / JCM 20966 / LMG 6465 / NBRC 14845 / NCIMB 13405 / ORS 571) TaxID=438753 RepID=A8IPG2_AZOC5|nr:MULTISPECIES: response regulator [Azorhizobium]TDT88910.1 response regulator receiver domain-containing protein [Azorhizobium sp. AG788]BAF86616.1 regulatory protein [Azorhizobium caulinodans ORS 571]